MATYWTTTEEQRRTIIGELVVAVIEKHFKGLYVGIPQNGQPFGIDAIAIPVYRTNPKGRLHPRFICMSGMELRLNTGLNRTDQLIASKIKQFLKACPKSWVQPKKTN